MTEAEWLAVSVPERMLAYLGDRTSSRKLRYFLVACARSVLPADADSDILDALHVAERYADGSASKYDLARARAGLKPEQPARVVRWSPLYTLHVRSVPAWHANREQVVRAVREGTNLCVGTSTLKQRADGSIYMDTYPGKELATQSHLLRDIFGNPFRPVAVDPEWLTSTVVALARGIYDERAFDRMPVLADALQDSGCEDGAVLDHCRGPGPHARGCWVVDLLLGKS